MDPERIRPTETECNHAAERALKIVLEKPDETAARIDSDPNPMYVTVEDGEFVFWCFNYTWKCQEKKEVSDAHGRFKRVVEQIHAYANSGYAIGTVAKDRIDTERKPRPTGLDEFGSEGGESA